MFRRTIFTAFSTDPQSIAHLYVLQTQTAEKVGPETSTVVLYAVILAVVSVGIGFGVGVSRGGSTSGSRSTESATPTTEELAPSGDSAQLSRSEPGHTAETEMSTSFQDLVDTGDDFRDKASNYRNREEYDRALDSHSRAQESYARALETATESDPVDTSEIEQKLATVQDERRTVHRYQLRDEVESLRSGLDHADTLTDENPAEARDRLESIESRLVSASETATNHGFDDLQDEIAVLEQRREDCLATVSKGLKAHRVPNNIPRAPAVSVDFDAASNEQALGGGGNADVSKATFSAPDGDVTLAIKRPRMSGTLHADAVERMLEEAQTWDKVKYPAHGGAGLRRLAAPQDREPTGGRRI